MSYCETYRVAVERTTGAFCKFTDKNTYLVIVTR